MINEKQTRELEYGDYTTAEKVKEKLNEYHSGPFMTLVSNLGVQDFKSPTVFKMGDLEKSLTMLECSSIYRIPKEKTLNEYGYDTPLKGDNGDTTRTISVCLGGSFIEDSDYYSHQGKLNAKRETSIDKIGTILARDSWDLHKNPSYLVGSEIAFSKIVKNQEEIFKHFGTPLTREFITYKSIVDQNVILNPEYNVTPEDHFGSFGFNNNRLIVPTGIKYTFQTDSEKDSKIYLLYSPGKLESWLTFQAIGLKPETIDKLRDHSCSNHL